MFAPRYGARGGCPVPNQTLLELLESDKEMILANLARDRSPAAAQTALEKAIDRVMYRYVEACPDPAQRNLAQYLLQTMKNTVPLVGAVGEAREWKKTVEVPSRGLRPAALGFLIGGAALIAAAVLAMMITAGFGLLNLVKALLPALLGGACLFRAGQLSKVQKKGRKAPQADVRTEFLVDVDEAWHCLRGAMLMADHQLDAMRQEAAANEAREAAAAAPVDHAQTELFAQLLESAYAIGGAASEEMVSDIRFFLHNAQVDVVDYEPGREAWFEFLPAQRPGTLRPALATNGRLLKKGMAAR